jgi:hypothetical protein
MSLISFYLLMATWTVKDLFGKGWRNEGRPAKKERANYPCGKCEKLIQIRTMRRAISELPVTYNFYYVGVTNTTKPERRNSEPVRTFAQIHTQIKKKEWLRRFKVAWRCNDSLKNKYNADVEIKWTIISVEYSKSTEKDIDNQLDQSRGINGNRKNSERREFLYLILGVWEKMGPPDQKTITFETSAAKNVFGADYYNYLMAWFGPNNSFHYENEEMLTGLNQNTPTNVERIRDKIQDTELSADDVRYLIKLLKKRELSLREKRKFRDVRKQKENEDSEGGEDEEVGEDKDHKEDEVDGKDGEDEDEDHTEEIEEDKTRKKTKMKIEKKMKTKIKVKKKMKTKKRTNRNSIFAGRE